MEKLNNILLIIGLSIIGLTLVYYVIALLNMAIMDPIIHEIKVKLGLKEKSDFKERDPGEIISNKQEGLLKVIVDFLNSLT